MTAKIPQQYCESALAIFGSQFQATRVLQHNATAGTAREQIIRDFLTLHLPELDPPKVDLTIVSRKGVPDERDEGVPLLQ
jgi:hypothetical protein